MVIIAALMSGLLTTTAQEPFPPDHPIIIETLPPPIPEQRAASGVYLRRHHVDVNIENQVAVTRIEQIFVNPTDFMAEGTYIFPLPRGASVTDLVMYVDGRPIQARILGADEARQTYEEIVRQLRDPALLEYIGQDAIQANIFPIQARSEVKIEIEYRHVLVVENGLVRYTYPLRTDQFSTIPVDELSISVNVQSNDAIGSIYSPSHNIGVSREGEFAFRAGYEAYRTQETSNFNLYYSLASEEIDVNLLTYRESANEDGFFLLLIAPPFQADDSQIQPRDVIVVLDQSGSMYGEKWDQARQAAKYVLDQLNPEDRFNVVAFSTGWRLYANDLQNPSNVRGAKDWLEGLEAEGGTEIDAALEQAFQQADSERQTIILFLTDGLPTEGETDSGKILEGVRASAPSNVRIFSFGVGDDVDTFLLDSLSSEFGGVSAYVRPTERIDEEVSALYTKIASPVMTNIQLDFGTMRVEDLYPAQPLPDLFVGSQLIIAGRYRGDGTTSITLTGEVGGERREVVYYNMRFPANAGGESSIPRLWATRKIGAMLNSIRLNGENPELVESIVRLSTRYGIITPYTSFFIDETDIFTEAGRDEAEAQAAQSISRSNEQVSGEGAVQAADQANAFESAEVAAPAPTAGAMPQTGSGGGGSVAPAAPGDIDDGFGAGQTTMQVIQDRTFLLRDAVWIDTQYDADTMELTEIVFLSEKYFDLLEAHPEIAPFLRVGEHLILVIEGRAYEIKP
jgi:Ca-activated chloride channel family protein